MLMGARARTTLLAMLVLSSLASTTSAFSLGTNSVTIDHHDIAGTGMARQLQFVDVRDARHCHNTPRRTYCHTKENLPVRVPDSKVSSALRIRHVS